MTRDDEIEAESATVHIADLTVALGADHSEVAILAGLSAALAAEFEMRDEFHLFPKFLRSWADAIDAELRGMMQ